MSHQSINSHLLDPPFFDTDMTLFFLLFEVRSFSKVARVSGLSQPTISKSIRRLESRLGFDLFTRDSRPITPTTEGKILYQDLLVHSGEMSKTLARLRAHNIIRPILRLGCVESLSTDMLPELIIKLIPQVSKISQVTATANILLEQLLSRQLDVIISSDSHQNCKDLIRVPILQDCSVLLMPKKLASKHKNWSWDDLRFCGVPCLFYHSESAGGKLNLDYFNRLSLSFPEHVEVDFNSVMVRLVESGLGWTITRAMSAYQIRNFSDHVAILPLPGSVQIRQTYVISRAKENQSLPILCASVARKIITENIIPRVHNYVPWSKEHILVIW